MPYITLVVINIIYRNVKTPIFTNAIYTRY